MTIQWIEYPISIGDEDDEMTITWDDGSTDLVPANNGDGETVFQLPRLMDEVFRVENFNCFPGQSGQFIDEYPALLRSKTGAHVLRVMSEESFMNAFICQSRSAADCLISWMRGDLSVALRGSDNIPEGANDFHWVSIREVLGFVASGLLNDFPPIIFEMDENEGEAEDDLLDSGFEQVHLPWWYPPSRRGPIFGYPACLFLSQVYENEITLEKLKELSVAVSVRIGLNDDEWKRLASNCRDGTISDRIQKNSGQFHSRFAQISSHADELGEILLETWRNLQS